MSESVSTGGLMSFNYKGVKTPKMGKGSKKEIEKAYEDYYERKRKEKRNKILFILIALVVILGAVGLYFLIN